MKKFLLLGFSLMLAGTALMDAAPLASSKINGKINLKEKHTPLRLTNQNKVATRAISYDEPSGQWTNWEVMGSGTLNLFDLFDFYGSGIEDYEGSFPGLTLYWRQDVKNEAIRQFKLDGIFNDAEIIINWYPENNQLLKIAPQPTNVEGLDVLDFASAYELLGTADEYGMTEEEYDELIQSYNDYNYYEPTLGRLYIFLAFSLEGDVCGMGDLQFQIDGAIDYTPVLEDRTFYPANDPKMKVEFASQAAYAKYLISQGTVLNSNLESILNNKEGVKTLEKSGTVSLSEVTPNLLYSIMVVTYNQENIPLEMSYVEFSVVDDETDKWKSLGNVNITTDIFASVFDVPVPSLTCEVQENISTPGLYRYVNVFGANYPYNDPGDWDQDNNHYLIVDATDPDFVLLPAQFLGNDWGGGYFALIGMANYYMLRGESQASVAQYAGKLFADGTITFPYDSMLLWCAHWSALGGNNGSLYYANSSEGTVLRVPVTDSGINEISVSDNKEVKYFNLQGIEVKNPQPGQLLIMKSNDGVSKLLKK